MKLIKLFRSFMIASLILLMQPNQVFSVSATKDANSPKVQFDLTAQSASMIADPALSNVITIKLKEARNIKTEGDLLKRVSKNFDRLEEEKYQPSKVYLTDAQSSNWPGDTEGRTILGLVLDAPVQPDI